MQRYLSLVLVSVLSAFASLTYAQDTLVTSVDPELLAIQNARVPKEYTIRNIRVTGITSLDTAIVLSVSGLQSGDKVLIPGSDVFSKAITNLWRQRFFGNVQIFITAVQDDFIDLELNVQERPKLGKFEFIGPKKTERDELQQKVNLVASTIITETVKKNAREAIEKYYKDKGYLNVTVRIEEKKDPTFVNANSLSFYIDKGNEQGHA